MVGFICAPTAKQNEQSYSRWNNTENVQIITTIINMINDGSSASEPETTGNSTVMSEYAAEVRQKAFAVGSRHNTVDTVDCILRFSLCARNKNEKKAAQHWTTLWSSLSLDANTGALQWKRCIPFRFNLTSAYETKNMRPDSPPSNLNVLAYFAGIFMRRAPNKY